MTLNLPKNVQAEAVPWCDQHNGPLRNVRGADDRIVCWQVWWARAMDRSLPKHLRVESQRCRPGTRIVVDCRVPA